MQIRVEERLDGVTDHMMTQHEEGPRITGSSVSSGHALCHVEKRDLCQLYTFLLLLRILPSFGPLNSFCRMELRHCLSLSEHFDPK
ncbi:hypothetical protein L798_15352 [Zootermopsis nevadensis]|uniref:Uncharacterized protein n=1 Tax=Zootermopsis nevadensis TaxID=136037 RepID=A0A067QQM9_ZOONE|nr:hypothetical protein L798_15352 [Zootermopsis nevadensis]